MVRLSEQKVLTDTAQWPGALLVLLQNLNVQNSCTRRLASPQAQQPVPGSPAPPQGAVEGSDQPTSVERRLQALVSGEGEGDQQQIISGNL